MRFSPDGKTLASSSHDRSVKLWDVEVAIKIAGEADAAAQKLQASRDALAAAADAANSAGMVETLKKKADALQAVLAFKTAEAKQNQVKEGADKYKDNAFLNKYTHEFVIGSPELKEGMWNRLCIDMANEAWKYDEGANLSLLYGYGIAFKRGAASTYNGTFAIYIDAYGKE